MSSDQRRAASISVVPREVAVLVPCYNEEGAIAKVVADFRAALPDAALYVYDNNSTDGTVAAAEKAGRFQVEIEQVRQSVPVFGIQLHGFLKSNSRFTGIASGK